MESSTKLIQAIIPGKVPWYCGKSPDYQCVHPSLKGIKKWQATYIAPLRPHTLAAFPPWGILQELVV